MKKKYLILSIFAIVFTACETDFDVNATWEEVIVVYGLLDAGDGQEVQQIKISKAFLGEMDALQMAQYFDSINFDPNDLDVKIVRVQNNGDIEMRPLSAEITIRDGDLFNDTIMIYTFDNLDAFLQSNSEYELVIKNKISGNIVTSKTNIILNFDFDNVFRNANSPFQFGFYNNNEYSSSTITWDDSGDNGKIYQLDLVIHYSENQESKQLIFSQDLVSDNETKLTIEGGDFFNFLRVSLEKDNAKVRHFNGIDLVMTVGSEDLETYINVNKPITGIVQERPYFTNVNNGIGLFSSRFTKVRYNFPLTSSSLDFLKSVDGLDRNFQ